MTKSEELMRVYYGCYTGADISEIEKLNIIKRSELQVENSGYTLSFEADGKRWWFNPYDFNGEHWTAEAQDGEKRALTEVDNWHGSDEEGELVGYIFGDVPCNVDYLGTEEVEAAKEKLYDVIGMPDAIKSCELYTISFERRKDKKPIAVLFDKGYKLDEFARYSFDELKQDPSIVESYNIVVPVVEIDTELAKDQAERKPELYAMCGEETALLFSKDIVLKEDNILHRWREQQKTAEIKAERTPGFER